MFRATALHRLKRRVEIDDDLSQLVNIMGGAHIPLRNNHLFLSWLAVLPSNELTAISTYFQINIHFPSTQILIWISIILRLLLCSVLDRKNDETYYETDGDC